MKYKTRFAPSPTGMLHIGGVRTALFNYLAAKSTGGEFYLRIEDTDRERFVEGAVEAINDGLKWLGINYNSEVVYQSERLPLYKEYADELIKNGFAYKCFCTPERLAALKEEQVAAHLAPTYDRRCLELTDEEIKNKEINESFVIRFKIPENSGNITWQDKIRGKITIQGETLEDFILIKSDGWPTYNFANVIDDHEQGFSLIIRGDEFVPSTPKHILIYKALGWQHPEFAHVPVIVGTDMKKLSKRNGDTAISDYKAKGYLPEALLNFLALLGWNPGTTEEIFTLNELENKFLIDRVGKSPSVFDPERLDWMNGLYIRNLSVSDLNNRLIEFDPKLKKRDTAKLEKIITVEQSRMKTLKDFSELTQTYWELPKYDKSMLIFKKSNLENTQKGLRVADEKLREIDEKQWDTYSAEDWNILLSKIVENDGLNNADLFWPLRVALTGLEKSASPAELLWVLGKTESLNRLGLANKIIEK